MATPKFFVPKSVPTTMATPPNKIILQNSDNIDFILDKEVAMEFVLVKNYLDDPDVSSTHSIPLPNVSSECLVKILNYCKAHIDFRARKATEEDIKKYDNEFVKELDNESLKEVMVGANYLEIKYLLDMLFQATADRIENKSVEYVRNFFGIKNDYSPQEENNLRTEYAWAFEGVDSDEVA